MNRGIKLFNMAICPLSRLFTSVTAALMVGEPLFWMLGMRDRRKTDCVMLKDAWRILVIRMDAIGDVILSTPFLRELRKNAGRAWITLIVNPETYPLAEKCPYVNEVLTYSLRAKGAAAILRRHFFALIFSQKHLWRRKFDLMILPRWGVDYYKASFLSYFSGAKCRIAYSEKVSPEKADLNKGVDRLFTKLLYDIFPRHEVTRSLKILTELGGRVTDDSLEMWTDDKDEKAVASLMSGNNIHDGELLIGIGPGARGPIRRWPVERYYKVVEWLLSARKAKILLLGDEEDFPLGKYIQEKCGIDFQGRVINFMKKVSVRELACVLKRCRLYIGNDTGIMHIAAAMKVPVIEILSCSKKADKTNVSSPFRFGPWGTRHIVLNPDMPIAPCRDECVHKNAHCILKVTVDDVKRAAQELT